MRRSIGDEVFQVQNGTGKVVGIEGAMQDSFSVEFASGTKAVVKDSELFNNYQEFAERNAESYHS